MRRQMAALVLAVKEGGLLCLSGLRPQDAPLIRRLEASVDRVHTRVLIPPFRLLARIFTYRTARGGYDMSPALDDLLSAARKRTFRGKALRTGTHRNEELCSTRYK